MRGLAAFQGRSTTAASKSLRPRRELASSESVIQSRVEDESADSLLELFHQKNTCDSANPPELRIQS